ncbi:helix-turn-helix domain-containing protein [Oerskovia sp. Sa1BUA8]|uniref:Helix-turn-helix domain-containing protein n=1 Tax=Oerskovia douganii TaxID=2762210 RepID=A0A9D5Z0K9_9CELL|nr:helix-turn-helix domain-containing protein [Oerskovia douganii]
MVARRMSSRQVADMFGIARTTVYRHLNRSTHPA